ncbi:MAG: hypothetical protein R2932_51605 [Caldilineaceae bacterium]
MSHQVEETVQLHMVKELHNFTIQASDGDMGRIADLIISPSD